MLSSTYMKLADPVNIGMCSLVRKGHNSWKEHKNDIHMVLLIDSQLSRIQPGILRSWRGSFLCSAQGESDYPESIYLSKGCFFLKDFSLICSEKGKKKAFQVFMIVEEKEEQLLSSSRRSDLCQTLPCFEKQKPAPTQSPETLINLIGTNLNLEMY